MRLSSAFLNPELCVTGMIGVNGQQVVIDSSRQIVAVKLSSYPSYTDDWADDVWWKGYEAMVAELTGERDFKMRVDRRRLDP